MRHPLILIQALLPAVIALAQSDRVTFGGTVTDPLSLVIPAAEVEASNITSAPYYNDYRYQRRPQDSMTIGRTFELLECVIFHLRVQPYIFSTEQKWPIRPVAILHCGPRLLRADVSAGSAFSILATWLMHQAKGNLS
jgi:hypothetical protein